MLREVRYQCYGVSQWQKVTPVKIDRFLQPSFWIRWMKYSLVLCMPRSDPAQYMLMVFASSRLGTWEYL